MRDAAGLQPGDPIWSVPWGRFGSVADAAPDDIDHLVITLDGDLRHRHALIDGLRRVCPDRGVCHHDCVHTSACFRVATCEPLSGVYPDNAWPAASASEEAIDRG